MNPTLRILGALSWKYLGDVVKNPSLLVCCIMPIVIMALLGSLAGGIAEVTEDTWEFLQYLTATSLVFVSSMVPSTATLFPMSEERDKRTLRTMVLAGVSTGQMVAARGIVGVVMVAAVNIGCYLVIGTPLDGLPIYTLIGIAGSLPLVLYSLAAGTVARDQMAASVYCLPAVLAGLMPTLFYYGEALVPAIPFLPTGGAFRLVELIFQGDLLTQSALVPFASMLVWIALAAALLAVMLKRAPRNI